MRSSRKRIPGVFVFLHDALKLFVVGHTSLAIEIKPQLSKSSQNRLSAQLLSRCDAPLPTFPAMRIRDCFAVLKLADNDPLMHIQPSRQA